MSNLRSLKNKLGASRDITSSADELNDMGVPPFIFNEYYEDDIVEVSKSIDYYGGLLKDTVNKYAGYNVGLIDFSLIYYEMMDGARPHPLDM